MILSEARRLATWHAHSIEELSVPRPDGKLETLMVCDCESSAVIVVDDTDMPHHVEQSGLFSEDCPHASLREAPHAA